MATPPKSWPDSAMSKCKGGIEKTDQASHIKTGFRPGASCVPMGELTTPMEFLHPGILFAIVEQTVTRPRLHNIHLVESWLQTAAVHT